jgi:hypothetical protein
VPPPEGLAAGAAAWGAGAECAGAEGLLPAKATVAPDPSTTARTNIAKPYLLLYCVSSFFIGSSPYFLVSVLDSLSAASTLRAFY